MQRSPNRRDFLRTTSAGAAAISLSAASYARTAGANERIAIGVIGLGGRGFRAHMPGVHKHSEAMNCEITAVADPWKQQRERATAKVKEWYGRPPRAFSSYEELLALDDVDAVMIASCDHQHTTHLEATAKAGKDVYCEKPLAMDMEKLKRACDAVKAANVVCQIGTQVRSYPTSTGCRELFRTGVLGKVSRIEQCRNGTQPYWYSRVDMNVKKQDVDWKEFLMDRPMEPFRADRFTGWYGYRAFSDGPIPGLASHFVDLINYIVGTTIPSSAVAQAGTFTWKDEHGFTCPDHVEATWVYPEGFMVNYSTNFGNRTGNCLRICGDQGVIDLSNWRAPTVSNSGAGQPSELGEAKPVESIETPDHFLDWLQCIRTHGTCRAPIEAGYQHSVTTLMAVRAHDTGQRQIYDAEKREIRAG